MEAPLLTLPNGYYELPKGKLVNVATFLEMLQAPTRTLQPLPPSLTLQKVDPQDLQAYRHLFNSVGRPWMWFSRALLADDTLHAILASPKVDSFTLLQNGQPAGILELNFEHETDAELTFFGLMPGAMGAGLGRALMDEALRRAWAKGISRLWVHTCSFDAPQALPFYIRSGFVPFTRMIEVHDDPRYTGEMPPDAAGHIPII